MIAALDIFTFIQGAILGILLILSHKKRKKNSLWLGIFLILFSLHLLNIVLNGPEFGAVNHEFFLLPFNFSWLLFAIFLIYTHKISVHSNKRISYLLVLPGLIAFFAQLFIYFKPYQVKMAISQNFWYSLFFTYIGIFYSWCLGAWNFRLLYLHKTEIRNSFSKLHSRKLGWLTLFLAYALASPIITHFFYFIVPQHLPYRIIFTILDVIAIYWIAIHGLRQHNVSSILPNEKESQEKDAVLENTRTNIAMEDLEVTMKKIDDYMKIKEPFVDTDLTIVDVSNGLNIHPKRISTAINTVCNQNFNTYVNRFRVKKAEKLLTSDEFKNLSIEGIALEAGFHSRSAFYSAFKKQTGTTPTRYRGEVMA